MWKVKIENTISGEKFESKSELLILHVANRLSGGLLETQSLTSSYDTEEDFRMFLSLGRALQCSNFGHISPRVGQIVDEIDIIKEV